MQIKKSLFVTMIILAVFLGGIGTYFGTMFFTEDSPVYDLTEESDGTTTLSEAEYQEIIESISDSVALPKVVQAFQIIQEYFLESVEDDDLIEGAVRGMLNTLDDPYSEYMDSESMERFNEQIESSFEGIGAEVSMVDGRVTIVAPIKDSPAEKAGLRPNDQILTVDDESVEGLDLFEAVSKIRGEKGSEVTLEIIRPGVSNEITITLVRDTIPLETVYTESQEVNGDHVGFIQITSFSENTGARFKEDLATLEDEGIDGLVIDVRGNPGGLLPVIQDILQIFITKDQPYMQIEDGQGEVERYYSTLEEPKDYPISVLIDEGSASASEILAISLREAIDATIVGTTSFGKGTVQQTIPMGDGSSIKLTLFNWLSPEGASIHRVGVEPTIEVEQPEYYYVAPIQVEEDAFVYNDSDDNIGFAQIMLRGLGYQVDRTDGYFSQQTEDALIQFQSDQSIEESGELNSQTAELLQVNLIEQIRSGENDLQREKAFEVLFQ